MILLILFINRNDEKHTYVNKLYHSPLSISPPSSPSRPVRIPGYCGHCGHFPLSMDRKHHTWNRINLVHQNWFHIANINCGQRVCRRVWRQDFTPNFKMVRFCLKFSLEHLRTLQMNNSSINLTALNRDGGPV